MFTVTLVVTVNLPWFIVQAYTIVSMSNNGFKILLYKSCKKNLLSLLIKKKCNIIIL